MAGEYIEFNNASQPAINDTNLNRLQQLIKQDIQGAVSGDTLPIGAIIPFGSDTIPENWLLCDGSAVSRTTYQDLFNTIGTTFGAGDGFTTFNLPNMKGRNIMGAGKPAQNSSSTFGTITQEQMQNWDFPLGETSGEFKHTLTVDEMPEHNHKFNRTADAHNLVYQNGDTPFNDGTGESAPAGTTTNTGGGQAHNNLQPYIVTNYIIKASQTSGLVATVVDNLNSNSATNALSAKQGKLLGQYSIDETIVGTWIDGKPIYRKVVDIGSLPNNTTKNVAHNISNINFVTKVYLAVSTGMSFYNANMQGISDMYSSGTVVVRVQGANINIGTNYDYSVHSGYAVIEYTKTTD